MSIYKSDFGSGIIDKKNIEFFVFIDALINLVRFEAFAGATFLDFADFQSAPVSYRQHFTDGVVNSVGHTFDPSRIFLKEEFKM